ncbi:preprotein translocase subunit SecA [Actinoalloteichus sp. AHMU CJ021]|uniref:Protein translocase subunit SecA n=2 Tax=Actinoalloteichus cyanogriseus TaxID=2893586 RepID=A0ABT1JN87_ACTCY|nr:preprotein translocase subunit SecA [Actinoalloteichus caeruleus]AUS79416.1 preprotein translocase subunit SecA [Actinoalloteichus sp. AHMU CJ021]MCP2333724.1 protein translocase subunit secA [Actinoalloteichus caeruleus DSM 43889]
MVLSRLLRAGEGKTLKRLRNIAAHVNSLEEEIAPLTDDQLRAKTDEFRSRHADGESLDELLPEAFAVVREAAKRTLGQRHFDVQLMGGAALHLGQVAEMRTGEGKTLTSSLPAYLNAISGEGVHVVTTNDYLAKRDSEWMGRVHRFLGLEVSVIVAQMTPEQRREAYRADITYGTNNEFGFDYLRDNMAWNLRDCVQRGHNFAVVDEVDSILIDEARTPLIISGPADQSSRWYQEFARIAPLMEREKHYEVDERKRTIGVTEAGVELVEDQLGIENLYEAANTPLVGYLNNALKAKELFNKNKDYIVRGDDVMIVDEFTGRVLAGRRYNEGMHQAIEAKERVPIKAENQTLATITLQNYFRLYDKLSGMTGTAQTEAAELHQIYKLGVVTIPTNRTMQRKDQPDLVYKTEVAKFEAVAEDIEERHREGQPVLVGTTSVERSEHLSKILTKKGVKHEVLNAKHHEREAAIIALAGVRGAVTVATNMAGRGTDIVLGGNPDFIADKELRDRGLDPVETREEYEAAWDAELDKAKAEAEAEAELVREAGGLYVLGTERHESRRIDNQLRGRAGRQGDPGETRFYLSLGDELMRRFNASMVEMVMTRLRVPDDVPIEHKMVTRAIRSAQTQVEQQNFEIRKNVLKYDEVMNKQRTVIYAERRRVLEGEDLREQIHHMMRDVCTAYVEGAADDGYPEDWDLEQLWTALRTLYPVGIDWKELLEQDGKGLTKQGLLDAVLADAERAYERREAEINELVGDENAMRELERRVLLSVLDRKWREHLYEMDYLKEGIGLRAMAQRDPAIEYQREGFDMFNAMLDALKEESVGFLFNIQVEPPEDKDRKRAAGEGEDKVAVTVSSGAGSADPAATPGQARTNGNGGRRPAAPPPPAAEQAPVPAALRGKGLDGPGRQQLNYSGPDEAGAPANQGGRGGGRSGGTANTGGNQAGRSQSGNRKDRRAAARAQSKRDRRG